MVFIADKEKETGIAVIWDGRMKAMPVLDHLDNCIFYMIDHIGNIIGNVYG